MKTFTFFSKNSSVSITLSAENFEQAEELLFEVVNKDFDRWYVEDEEGEEEF